MAWAALTFATALLAILALTATFLAARRSRGTTALRSWAWRSASVLTFLLGVLALATTGWVFWYTHRTQPLPVTLRLFRGVTYTRDVRLAPRPMVIHVVTIDLQAEGVRLFVTPGEPFSGKMLRARKTTEFLDKYGLQVAINANFFFPFASNAPWDYYPRSGDPVDAIGIAASQGQVYSPTRWNDGTLYLSPRNEARFDRPDDPIYNAISGQGFLVRHGRACGPFEADLYPRAGLALDREARYLILVVIDGKQPNYSEGATLDEMAQILRDHGGHDAIRLDEGGSATLAIRGPDDRAKLLSGPINSRMPNNERPVANHLGLFADP